MTMKWLVSTVVLAISVTAAVGAQSARPMGRPSKGDAMAISYTGCVEAVNHGGTFMLTMAERSGSMHGDMGMTHDDHMAATNGAGKTMQHDEAPMADATMAGTSKAIALAGSASIKKHIGQKVTVTGTLSDGMAGSMRQDVATLTVKTLKVLARSCS